MATSAELQALTGNVPTGQSLKVQHARQNTCKPSTSKRNVLINAIVNNEADDHAAEHSTT